MPKKVSKKELMEIRESFRRQWELAKQCNDIFYMEFFDRQIKELTKQIDTRG